MALPRLMKFACIGFRRTKKPLPYVDDGSGYLLNTQAGELQFHVELSFSRTRREYQNQNHPASSKVKIFTPGGIRKEKAWKSPA